MPKRSLNSRRPSPSPSRPTSRGRPPRQRPWRRRGCGEESCREPGKPGAEGEGLDAGAPGHQDVGEAEQGPGVGLHGPAHVAEKHQSPDPWDAADLLDADQLAAPAHRRRIVARQVGSPDVPRHPPAVGGPEGGGEGEGPHRVDGFGELFVAAGGEVFVAQDLGRAVAEDTVVRGRVLAGREPAQLQQRLPAGVSGYSASAGAWNALGGSDRGRGARGLCSDIRSGIQELGGEPRRASARRPLRPGNAKRRRQVVAGQRRPNAGRRERRAADGNHRAEAARTRVRGNPLENSSMFNRPPRSASGTPTSRPESRIGAGRSVSSSASVWTSRRAMTSSLRAFIPTIARAWTGT